MKPAKPVIQLKEVWKTYRMGNMEVHALRGLNLEIRKGEFVSVMGPSGSGKSTAVNLIGCLDIPSKGQVLLDGHDIAVLEESDLAQIRGKKIGFIFQQFNLIPTLTAQENVALPMVFQGIPEAQRLARAAEVLKLVELDDRMHHKPAELSGGQQQRVAIARALALEPEVILADEPTGNLDSKTGGIVMDFLRKLHQQGHTIIMVTHDANLAQYADRVEYLKDGVVVQSRSSQSTSSPPSSRKRTEAIA